MLRKILGPKRDMTRDWRKLHDEELHDLYSSPSIIQVIKFRRMRLAGHAVWMGRGQVHTGFWWGELRERDHLEDLGIDRRIKTNYVEQSPS
jgi:hypothetical protein